MIIVKIYGGLGNQLFQYAAAKNFGLKYQHEVFIDKSWFDNIPKENTKRIYYLDKYSLEEKYLNYYYHPLRVKLLPYFVINKNLFRVINENKANNISNKGDYILDGYWQGLRFINENNRKIINSLNMLNKLCVEKKNY